MTASLEAIDWHRFLARPPLPAPAPASLAAFREARILVTGAGGSIGSALALRLTTLEPHRLVLLEAAESQLFALQHRLARAEDRNRTTFALGSTSDAALLDEILTVHAPQIAFHAAAFKQVPLLEEQPLAAIANNIFGTQTLVQAAARHGVRLVLLSTDKAVEPASVMGATKRVAEQLVLRYGGTALRLGNVLASRDSVAEIFAQALAAGEPISVTDPAARRYFLTLEEAVDLLLAAAIEPAGLYAAALPASQYIVDLARFMAAELAPGREAAIEFTRLRSGDKEAERLWAENERAMPAGAPGLFALTSPLPEREPLSHGLQALRAALDARDAAAALARLCTLVPEYAPSAAVRALAAQSPMRTAR
ncbi:MAG TPA: polysaccharide biosynthesis protein [Terracidiphilus sp.]|nr:polysaccharide biosynthesis protein [Terracidiphilus sp.]